MLRIPLIALTLAGLGGALVGQAQVTPLRGQEALCSWGSTTPCQEIHTCTERAWSIGLRSWNFAIGNCLSWKVEKLYFSAHAMSGSKSGQNDGDDDPADEPGTGDDTN